MKLVLLIGDGAVGKMTVGQALAKLTGLSLFHNHMTIEPVIELFGGYNHVVVDKLREVIFEEFAASDRYGLIFTYVWAFDMQADWDYIAHVRAIFESHGAQVYCAELIAPQEVRLARNETANRLAHKPSKRDLDFARKCLLEADAHHRCVSLEGEVPFENYVRIDNSELSPEEAAEKIRAAFGL